MARSVMRRTGRRRTDMSRCMASLAWPVLDWTRGDCLPADTLRRSEALALNAREPANPTGAEGRAGLRVRAEQLSNQLRELPTTSSGTGFFTLVERHETADVP